MTMKTTNACDISKTAKVHDGKKSPRNYFFEALMQLQKLVGINFMMYLHHRIHTIYVRH